MPVAERNIHVLLLSDDASLRSEVEDSLRELESLRAILHVEPHAHRGTEVARSLEPDLIVLELNAEIGAFCEQARALEESAPNSRVVAACQSDLLQAGGSAGALMEAMRFNVRDFIRRPISAVELEQILLREESSPQQTAAQTGRVLSFVSNKGGAGKSTAALSTAVALARQHRDRVLLLDASLQFGVCASMLDLDPASTLADAAREVDRLDPVLLRSLCSAHHSGLHVLAAPPDAVEAARVTELSLARILRVARSAFDYVVVDTFPMIDGCAISILDASDLIYVVQGSMVPVVQGGVPFLKVLHRLGVPDGVRRVVLNEGQPSFRGRLKATDVAQNLGVDIDHVLPFQKQLLVAMNTGDPWVLRASRWNRFRKAVAEIVSEIESVSARRTDSEPSVNGVDLSQIAGEVS